MNTKVSIGIITTLSVACVSVTTLLLQANTDATLLAIKQEQQEQQISALEDALQELSQPKPFEYQVVEATTYNLPLDSQLQTFTYSVCQAYGIQDEYELVLALMWQESDFDASAISSSNDYGLMQINKVNHASLSKVLPVDDFLDPEQNIIAGVYTLSQLFDRYDGDEHKVLMAYNMGPSRAAALWKTGIYSSYYSRDILDKRDKLNSYYDAE